MLFLKAALAAFQGTHATGFPTLKTSTGRFKLPSEFLGRCPKTPPPLKRRAKLLIAIAVSLEDKVFQLLCVMDEGIGAVFFELFFVPEAPGDAGGEEAGVLPGLHINAAVADIQAFGGGDA